MTSLALNSIEKEDYTNWSADKKAQAIVFIRNHEIRLAKKSFWHFCKLLEPDFYKEKMWHLKHICNTLQGIYEGTIINPETGKPYKKLLMSIPPRFGKSRTLVNFSRWLFGKSKKNRIITASYNDEMAVEFSRFTRDGIREKKTYPHETDYSDIFPDVKIKDGNAAFHQWALEGEFFNYKGAGLNGGLTGKGCNIAICDDLVKDHHVAFNDDALKKIWDWYRGTFLSRIEKGGIEIVNMTRWSKNDVIGRILQTKQAKNWLVLRLPVIDNYGNLLCEDIIDQEKFEFISDPENMDPFIYVANYLQQPIDLVGSIYDFKTYENIPSRAFLNLKLAYADLADRGKDFLSMPFAVDGGNGFLYVTDWIYTQDIMNDTIDDCAAKIAINEPDHTYLEGNNGGAFFTDQLTEKVRNNHGFYGEIESFHQSGNKIARIRSTRHTANNIMLFPSDWADRWPALYANLTTFKIGNESDDGADSVAGLIEKYEELKGKQRSPFDGYDE